MSMRQTILAALLATTLLAGCGGDDGAGPATKATIAATAAASAGGDSTDTIRIVDFVYDPSPASVRAGQRISIANADAAPHTITDGASGDKAFDSGTIKGKASGSLTIDEPGTYSYICEFHPFMKGEITVTK
jgi:plastocyanin